MPYATAPHTRRNSVARRHGILPTAALPVGHDWGEVALQRTWRSAGAVLMLIGLVNAFVSRLPAALFFILGVWAHLRGNPQMRDRLASHAVLGAPLRWWMGRMPHTLDKRRDAQPTRPQA